jgi:hypothetical protein
MWSAEGVALQLTICVCYSWQTELNADPIVSCDNVYDWEGVGQRAGDNHVTNDKGFQVNIQPTLQ